MTLVLAALLPDQRSFVVAGDTLLTSDRGPATGQGDKVFMVGGHFAVASYGCPVPGRTVPIPDLLRGASWVSRPTARRVADDLARALADDPSVGLFVVGPSEGTPWPLAFHVRPHGGRAEDRVGELFEGDRVARGQTWTVNDSDLLDRHGGERPQTVDDVLRLFEALAKEAGEASARRGQRTVGPPYRAVTYLERGDT